MHSLSSERPVRPAGGEVLGFALIEPGPTTHQLTHFRYTVYIGLYIDIGRY